MEVIAHGHHNVGGAVLLGEIGSIVDELVHPGLHIVVVAVSVDNGLIAAPGVEAEARWGGVVLVEHSSKEIHILQGLAGIPDHLQAQVIHSLVFVSHVHAGKELAVEAHLGENRGLFTRVAKSIDLPTDSRATASTKVVIQEP